MTNYIQMLVKIKEILTEIIFICPAKLLVPIYATYITIYRLHFWSKFSPAQGLQAINYRFFHSLFTPLELKIEFWATTLYRHTDRHRDANDSIYIPHSDPVDLPIPNTVQIWLKWFQNEDKHMVLSCMRAMINMSTTSSTCLPEHGNSPKCHILSSL